MSAATTETAPTWAPAIRRRRRALLQRLGMGAASAMVFSPLFGWKISVLWVAVYFLIQVLEIRVFKPVTDLPARKMGPIRTALGFAVLFLNATAFGSLTIPLWIIGGPMGGVCAAVVSASAAIYGVINSPRSPHVLAVTLTPHCLYMSSAPIFMVFYGASASFVTAAAVAFAVFAPWACMFASMNPGIPFPACCLFISPPCLSTLGRRRDTRHAAPRLP
jgi:hypothetical protein